ncbi:MAG: HEAT repeat domain-containing protein [Planctomycetota bacterium]
MMSTILLTAFLTVGMVQDDPQPASGYGASWEPKVEARPEELESKQAREAVSAFKDASKSGEPHDKIEALKVLLVAGRHESMVQPVSDLLKDRDAKVRQEAARTLGTLGYPKAIKILLMTIRHPLNEEAPDVRETAAEAIGRVSDKSIAALVEKDFTSGDQYTKRGLALAFGHCEDYRAAELLAEWLEKPQPGNVNSDRNPPASYWQQRWDEWRYVSPAVRWSVKKITGESYETRADLRDWVKRKGWRDREKKDDTGGN